ncbi:hypothetical protein CLAIMM_05065 [Cladophialophora immunda]|nr:hypothetical protein CLAIMM_05065 [Cladophialophora immunda]
MPQVTASYSLDSEPTHRDFGGTANPPLEYQDLDVLIGSGEVEGALRNHNTVDGDEASFAAASSMSQEMDMSSSGEESFAFNSQSPPSFDMGLEKEIENMVSEIALDLVQGFLSGSGRINVCTPQSSQGSPASSNVGDRPATGSCSSTGQASKAAGSSNKDKRHEHDGNEEPKEPQRPRIQSLIQDDSDEEGLLACPYAKYDADRYSEMNPNLHERAYRRCRSVYLTNIPRLKQHLYRIHRRPEYYCSSCYTEFKSESDCEGHARARPACAVNDCPFQEKMTHEQYKAVKRRKMRRDAASVWFEIFDILFPGAQRPGTPYVDDTHSQATMQSVQDYTRYLENHLPQMLSERMGRPLFNNDSSMFQWLLNKALEETLPRALRELQDSWQMVGSVAGINDDST